MFSNEITPDVIIFTYKTIHLHKQYFVLLLTQGEGSLQREVGGLSENCSTDRRKREPGASAGGELGTEDMRGPDAWARADHSAR